MMRIAAFFLITACATLAAQAPAQAPPTDRTKATVFTAADLKAAIAKLPPDRASAAARVFSLAPYNINVERRLPQPQNASLHEAQAEFFYVIEGSATMLTGGTLVAPTRTGTNLQGTGIEGGTRNPLKPGDFLMVPSGVAHQFVDLTSPVLVMSMYLPDPK